MSLSCTAILDFLGRFDFGCAVCGKSGAVLACNTRARDLFATFDPVAGQTHQSGVVPHLIWRLLQQGTSPFVYGFGRSRPIIIQKIAIPEESTMLLILADLNNSKPSHEDTLQLAFGLTPCEARVASGLSMGMRLEDLARNNGVAIGTIRGQLKSIFVKTDTRRQPELALLLARLQAFYL